MLNRLNRNWLMKLGVNGARLGWRVFAILLPVVGVSFWRLAREGLGTASETIRENQPPEILSRLEAWDAFDRGKIGAAEMAYYDEIYGDN